MKDKRQMRTARLAMAVFFLQFVFVPYATILCVLHGHSVADTFEPAAHLHANQAPCHCFALPLVAAGLVPVLCPEIAFGTTSVPAAVLPSMVGAFEIFHPPLPSF